MSSSSTSFDYVAVYAFFARFFAIRWRKEPRLSLDAEEVLTAAYRRIDEQDIEIKRLVRRDDLREIDFELLWSEVKWLSSVLKESRIVLSDYDYMRLQQLAIKVRAMRAR